MTRTQDSLVVALQTTDVDEEKIAQLRRRMVDHAEAERLIDIAYTTIDSPIGELLLATTEKGLVRVAFAVEDLDVVLENIAAKLSPRIVRLPRRLDRVAREMDEYFMKKRTSFDLAIDLSLSRGFRQLVQTHLKEIAYGQTKSYSEVAALVGNPKAVRAVGTACATNPLPVVVPCHRVLRSDGSLGGYLGGLQAKTALLELEAA
jgi:methylated-DNA-[protein]-cysteine S-methyltransferase